MSLDRLRVQINGGTTKTSANNSISLGVWNHVLATWDATGDVTLYINAAQSGETGVSADPAGITTTNAMRIGNRATATDRTFDGPIGEVGAFSTIFGVSDILRNYQATKWRYQ